MTFGPMPLDDALGAVSAMPALIATAACAGVESAFTGITIEFSSRDDRQPGPAPHRARVHHLGLVEARPIEAAIFGWYLPFGIVTPAAWVAMCATRYLHEFGASTEDFARVAVAGRGMPPPIPAAWFHGKPITLADH